MKTAEKIQTIRNSEEAVRRRWFWGLSAIFILILVFVWTLYIQSVLPKTKNAEEIKPETQQAEENTENGFVATIERGISEIGKQAENGWQKLGGQTSKYFSGFQNLIQKERSVDFKPANDLEFAPVPVEEIPATKLPATE